jgi:enoyl-CoA hydratase/carnithine racemase
MPELRNPITDPGLFAGLIDGPCRRADLHRRSRRRRTALAWGLVSRVVAPEALMPAARALAERSSINPPRHLRMAKRLLREGLTARLDGLLELAAARQGACHQTEDHAEAADALLEKRAPVFTGR